MKRNLFKSAAALFMAVFALQQLLAILAAKMGARKVYVAASHGILCGDAIKLLEESPIEEVVLSDTIPLLPQHNLSKIRVLSVAPILGETIKRIHMNESVSEMFRTLNLSSGQYQ